jgi:hypothetical protein
MDNYGLSMKGPFISEPKTVSPTYTSADAGRLLYDTTLGKMVYGDGIIGAFRMLTDIPKDAILLFESDTQLLGYTLLTDRTDEMVYITSGSGAGGEPGQGLKSGSTWTQPGHAHTGPSHAHNAPQHQHDLSNHYHAVAAHAHTFSHSHTYSGNTGFELQEGTNRATGGDNSHYHSYSGTTTGPTPGATDNASPNTGGPSYNATGNANALTTDYQGTGATSSAATANTWRPYGRNYTRQRRN